MKQIHFIAYALSEIRANGYISRATAEDRQITATGDKICHALMAGDPISSDLMDEALEVVKWGTFQGGNDFRDKINHEITSTETGSGYLTAFAVYDYIRETSGESGEWIGTVGEKSTIPWIELKEIGQVRPGQFGNYRIYKFVDDSGNTIKWFGPAETEMNEGDIYAGKCWIKSHSTYNGYKETIVSRMKLSPVNNAQMTFNWNLLD